MLKGLTTAIEFAVPLGMFECRISSILCSTADIFLLLGQAYQRHLALCFLFESLSFSSPITVFGFRVSVSLLMFTSLIDDFFFFVAVFPQSRIGLLTSSICVVALLGGFAFKISISCFSYFGFWFWLLRNCNCRRGLVSLPSHGSCVITGGAVSLYLSMLQFVNVCFTVFLFYLVIILVCSLPLRAQFLLPLERKRQTAIAIASVILNPARQRNRRK